MPKIEEKLKKMGLTLPDAPTPMATYVPTVRTGNLVFMSGVVPRGADGKLLVGKLGATMTVEQGYAAAKGCALALLANLKKEIGDLDKVVRIVKVLGLVNSAPDFTQPPAVVNGCSDLLVELYGDTGRHARSAVGVAALPAGVPVEVEMVVEVRG